MSFLALLLAAQVTASQAKPSVLVPTEVPDPMQIDVPLGASEGRGSMETLAVGKYLAYPEVSRFVCDQAKVRMLTVKKISEGASQVILEASVILLSEWPLQEVTVTMELLSAAGERVFAEQWPKRKLGTWSGAYKASEGAIKAPIVISAARWRELFADGKAPVLRIVVDIM